MNTTTTHIKQWVKQVAEEGDAQAFQKLFEFYFDALYLYARRYLRASEEAEEIVSDVFMALWQNRHKLPTILNLKGYLYTSVRNRAYNFIRDHYKIEQSALLEQNYNLVDQYVDPEHLYLSQELYEKIEAAIQALPDRCRQIFIMVREERKSYKEVAEKLSISPKTVENQMSIALKKLQHTLAPYLDAPPASASLNRGMDTLKMLLFLFFA